MTAFPIPPGEELIGSVGLDFLAVSEEEAWAYASWVTKRPFPEPPLPPYAQPVFEAANPLFPNQIANPHHIYEGLNAVRWRSQETPFDAGLRQTIDVPDASGAITVEAWGLVEAADSAEMALHIGIDPTGGDNPDNPEVVWSAASAPTSFTQFSVTAPAQGSTATVFLRGTLNGRDMSGTAVWDAVTIHPSAGSESSGVNLDFEAPFITQNSIAVPDGWTAWYQDSGYALTDGREADRHVCTACVAWADVDASGYAVSRFSSRAFT